MVTVIGAPVLPQNWRIFGEADLGKGQLISKCLFGVIIWTKKPTKFSPGFLP